VRARDGEVERAGVGLAGDERGFEAVAAFERGGASAQVEAALDLGLVLAVTGEAFVLQERLDTTDEELLRLERGEFGGRGERGQGGENEESG